MYSRDLPGERKACVLLDLPNPANSICLQFDFLVFTPATANICNVVLMRNHELFTGIEVKDKDGNVVGTSKIAARKVNVEINNSERDVFTVVVAFFFSR